MAKGISLHLGLNAVDPGHYDGWGGPLTACEADASDMEAIARSRGFTTKTLLTTQATRTGVAQGLRDAAASLGDGDIFFLSYSGHGGQLPDQNHDEIDGLDETWCLYDGQVLDDELNLAFAHFKAGVRIVVLSDSCHSGTVVKVAYNAALRASGALAVLAPNGVTPAIRAMPPDVVMRTYRKNQAVYDRIQADIPKNIEDRVSASVILISGCQDNQTSSDGQFNGLFTANLLQVWKKGAFTGGYKKFHQAILKRMPPNQSPNFYRIGAANPTFEKQRPFEI